ncbi:MAG: trypsin-like peptidase domain-containing protein, partial [Nitrospirae bacterium]|nr:trypsin-like peptidase domain-containing protein [Nitrospirota bacterium]
MPIDDRQIGKYLIKILYPEDQVNGTGFMCHPDGYALTCYHVIKPHVLENYRLNIIYQDVEYETEICLGYSSEDADIAVIYVPNLPPDVNYLPLDVHGRFKINEELYSFGYPQNNYFKKTGIPSSFSVSGSARIDNTACYLIKGLSVENIGVGYSGSPVIHKESDKVIGLISHNYKKTQAFMVPLDGLFDQCPFLKDYHDIFRKINEMAAEKAANELDKKLQQDKIIPLELECGIVKEKEPDKNEREGRAKEWDHSRQWDTFEVSQLFKELNSYILSSSVGAGKTTFLYWLAGEIIKKNSLIPVSVTCSDFEDMKTWDDLRSHLISTYHDKDNKYINKSDLEYYFDYHYDNGRCVFLFDGLDQIKKNGYSELVKTILKVFKGSYTIITSRPSSVIFFDTDADIIFLRLKSFSVSQQKEYFNGYYERAKELSVYASDLISVPMLAHMVKPLILANKDKDIPNRTELYDRFINYIIMKHSPNDEVAAENFGKTDKVKAALNHVAFKSLNLIDPEIQKVSISHHDESLFSISVDDITTFGLVNKIIERGDINERCLFFTHQSFQEYFAAQYICENEERINKAIDEMWSSKWKEVIKFLCGFKGIKIIEKIYSKKDNAIHSRLFMAVACLPETIETNTELRSEIIKRLKELTNQHPFERPAIHSLVSMGEIRYVEGLLTNKDYEVRSSTIKALVELKDVI